MELKTAIEILEYHQEWRLGKREDMIHEPKKLTEALDMVLNEVKKYHLADVMAMLPTAMITRVEVIDEKGRSYVNWKPANRIELQVQDNGKTLKVFVSQGN